MSETIELLTTKLSPPRNSASLLLRPRLLDLFPSTELPPFTLICAPAGFGKTTLTLQYLQHYKNFSPG